MRLNQFRKVSLQSDIFRCDLKGFDLFEWVGRNRDYAHNMCSSASSEEHVVVAAPRMEEVLGLDVFLTWVVGSVMTGHKHDLFCKFIKIKLLFFMASSMRMSMNSLLIVMREFTKWMCFKGTVWNWSLFNFKEIPRCSGELMCSVELQVCLC